MDSGQHVPALPFLIMTMSFSVIKNARDKGYLLGSETVL